MLGRVALATGFLLIWTIQHVYRGIYHDSVLYTLPALARIHPELLGNDIMLRFGSQDRYTFFSPIYATAIQLLGADWGAAALTFLWQISFFVSAALFARKLMPERFVWAGLAALCAVPGFYGPRTIFAVVEDFATPRPIAEALVLLGLTSFMARRYWIAGGLALLAAFLHPLMSMAGLAMAFFMSPASLRVKAYVATGVLAAGVAALLIVGAQGTELRFDAAWLHLLEAGTDYLFLKYWTVGSFARAAVVLGTLSIGGLVLARSTAGLVCRAALATALAGIVISAVGGDLLKSVLIVQMQLWRWTWIATALALLTLPFVAATAWSQGVLWRTVIILLGAAWLCVPEKYALEIMILVAVLAVVAYRNGASVPANVQRMIFLGACVLAAIAVLYHLAMTILFANAVPAPTVAPDSMNRLRAFMRSGALPLGAFLLLLTAVLRARRTSTRALLAAGSIALLAITVPSVFRGWTHRTYDVGTFRAFEPWRQQIPAGTEVLWFDSPLSSWLLLQRPNYLSNQQESSGLFSRPAAMAMKARVDRLAPFLDSEGPVGWSDTAPPSGPTAHVQPTLADFCSASDVKFVVTRKNLSAKPIATIPDGVSALYKGLGLYACPQQDG